MLLLQVLLKHRQVQTLYDPVLHGIPSIQLAKDFKSVSDFWYTLYHEIGHILLHGKKDIFMENVSYGDKDPVKEKEADEFASLWMNK